MRGVVPYKLRKILKLAFQLVPKLQEHKGKTYEPFKNIGNELHFTGEAVPMFFSGLAFSCQDFSPDFYTAAFSVS